MLLLPSAHQSMLLGRTFRLIPCTLIKKKTEFSSYIRKSRWDRVQSHTWGFLIYEEIHKYFTINEEAVSHIWLCTRSLRISSYLRKIFFSFLLVQELKIGLRKWGILEEGTLRIWCIWGSACDEVDQKWPENARVKVFWVWKRFGSESAFDGAYKGGSCCSLFTQLATSFRRSNTSKRRQYCTRYSLQPITEIALPDSEKFLNVLHELLHILLVIIFAHTKLLKLTKLLLVGVAILTTFQC